MTIYYSKSTGGFYDSEIHGNNLPSDVVEITHKQHQDLLAGQSNGLIITVDKKGNPISELAPVVTPTILQQIAALEATQTPRRMRDVSDAGKAWLVALEEQISALRAKL